ncbi:MAG: recombination mediator RecR [Phycisphaerae bacterium]
MSGYSETIERLIEQLGKLPGIGARSAERLAFHILKSSRDEALELAETIRAVKLNVHPCKVCNNPAEGELCSVCGDPRRDRAVICVVEQPKDLLALESAGVYRGVYHVLMGQIAPLKDVGADDLTIGALVDRVRAGGVKEVILATNPNVEGDGTSLHISSLLGPTGVKITRLARGLPRGSQIEYAGKSVLSDAINERRQF